VRLTGRVDEMDRQAIGACQRASSLSLRFAALLAANVQNGAYNQQQQYQLALSDCKTAIDLNPRYSYGYANLGATYLGLNDPARALSALNTAVALKTNFIWSRLSRAKAFEASGSNNEDGRPASDDLQLT
jgi:tetratricopeptide (TPR) repeat protein